jgi:guanine deaminase
MTDGAIEKLMDRAIHLALLNIRTTTGGPFAAVIARGDVVVAEGTNSVIPETDPTAHAEVVAIRRACRDLGTVDLTGHVLYSTCRPCPMCLAAAHWAKIERVYYALSSEDAERMGFLDAHLYAMFEDAAISETPPPIEVAAPGAEEIVRAWLGKVTREQYYVMLSQIVPLKSASRDRVPDAGLVDGLTPD